jgi:hypothetical protein
VGKALRKVISKHYKCFLIGARLNNASAHSQVNQLEPKLTPAELAEGQRRARLFKVK